MSSGSRDLVIRIRGDSVEFVAAVDGAGRKLDDFGDRLQSIDRATSATASSLARMGHGFTAFLGAREIIQAADDWGQFASRMRMATESAAEYEQAQQRMAASANETFRSINETRESFILMNPVLRQMGLSLDESIDAIDTFSGLLVVNAASSERASSAQAALAKSLQTGRIESDAWQSIMAAMPSLVLTLAKSSGMAEAEIRRLGVSGKLSVETLTAALVDANAAVLDQVRQMPTTVGDALTNLHNSFTEYVGSTNDAVGATRFFASTIGVVGEHFEALANAALLVAGGIAGRYVAALGIAGVEKAKLLLQTRAATIAEIAHQQSVARSAALQAQAALSSNALAAARQREAAATAAAAAAQAKLTTASSLASGAMTLLGGKIGLVTTVLAAGAAAWLLWGSRAADATKKAADAADEHIEGVLSRLRELNADIGRYTRGQADAAIGSGEQALKRNAAEAEMLASRIEKIKAEIGVARDFGYSQQHIRSKNAELIEAEHKYQDVLSREREIQARVATAREQAARAGVAAVQEFTDANVVGQTRVARERAKLQAEFDRVMRDAGGFNPALPEHVAAQAALNQKLVELGKSGRTAKTGLSEAEKATRDMIKAGVDLASTLDATAAGYAGDFFQKWESLSAAYRAGKISLEELIAAQGRYLAQQPGIKAAADAAEKAVEARNHALESLVGTESQRAASQEEANARAREELETLGMSEQQLAAYTAAKYNAAAAADEQAAAELDVAAALLDQQRQLPEVAAQYRRLAAEKRRSALANQEAAGLAIEKGNAEAAQAVNAEWERSSQQIESAIYDAIVSGGVDGAEILKRTINSLVLQPAVRMVVQGGTNAMMGLMGMAMPGSSSAGGSDAISQLVGWGAPKALGPLGGTAGLVSAGASLFAGTAAGAFGAGMAGGLSAFGSLAQTGAAISGGIAAGGAAGAGYVVGAVMPYVAAIAGIAAALGAFKGPTYHSGAAVEHGADDRQSVLRHKASVGDTRVWGGFTETDAKGGAAYAKPLQDLARGVTDTIENAFGIFGQKVQVSAYAAFGADGDDKSRGLLRIFDADGQLLGANSDQLLRGAKYSKDAQKGFLEFTADSAGVIRDVLLQADLPAWFDDMLGALGDTPSVDALAGVISQAQALVAVGERLGPVLGITTEQLAALAAGAGGVDVALGALDAYYQEYFSESERLAAATAALAGDFAELGLEMPATKAQFRQLMEGIDLTTDEGRELYAQLLAVAPAFAQVANAANAAADAANAAAAAQASSLMRRLWQAQGDIASMRAAELAELDASNWAIQQQIWALEDQASAATAASSATSSATDSLRALAEAGKRIQDYLIGLKSGALAALSPEAQLAQTRAQYQRDLAAARRGDLDALERMPQSTDAYLGAAQAYYASGDLYQSIFAKTVSELENLPAVKRADQLLLEATRDVVTHTSGTAAGVRQIPSVLRASNEAVLQLLSSGFGKIDRNTDGLLTREELVAAFVATGLATEADVDRLIQAYDANGDGVLSMLELQYARTGELSALGERSYALDAAAMAALVGGFSALDTTVDDLLDADELRAALVGSGLATEAGAARLLASFDANKDGQLSRLEVIGGQIRAQAALDAQTITILQTGFKSVDTSVNGLLDAGELRAALVTTGLATDADINRMILMFDANGDGQLSQLELIAANTAVMAAKSYTEYGGGTTTASGTKTDAGYQYTSTSSGGNVSNVTRDKPWTAAAYLAANPDVARYYAANAAQIAALGQGANLTDYASYHWAVHGIRESRKYARGGYAAPGRALVGEEGVEVANFRDPARIYSASQTRELMSPTVIDQRETHALLRQISTELRAVVRQGGAVGEATVARLDTLARRLDDMGAEVRRAVAA